MKLNLRRILRRAIIYRIIPRRETCIACTFVYTALQPSSKIFSSLSITYNRTITGISTRENAKGLKVLKKEVLGLLHFTCWAGGEPHHAELDRVLGEVILIQEAVQLALHLAPPVVALAQRAHRAIHSFGVLPPAEVRVGDDQADRHLGGRAVPSSRRELRLRARRSPPAIGRGDDRAEDHEDLDPHLSSSSFPLPSAPLFPSLTRIEKRPFLLDPCFTSPSIPPFSSPYEAKDGRSLLLSLPFVSSLFRREEDKSGQRHIFSALWPSFKEELENSLYPTPRDIYIYIFV